MPTAETDSDPSAHQVPSGIDPDRAVARVAGHFRQMWLLPLLALAWLGAEILSRPWMPTRFALIALLFAALYFVFAWRLQAFAQAIQHRSKELLKEQDRQLQAITRENGALKSHLTGLEERKRAAEQAAQDHQRAQDERELERQRREEAAPPAPDESALWPTLLTVSMRVSRQLAAAVDIDEAQQALARGLYDLAKTAGLSGRAALLFFDREGQRFARVALWPEPARRRLSGGQRSGPRRVAGQPLRFETDLIPLPPDSAAFWSLYVKREPFVSEEPIVFDTLEGEPVGLLALRVPLVTGREAVGHLCLSLDALPAESVQEALLAYCDSLTPPAALAFARLQAEANAGQAHAEQALLSRSVGARYVGR